MQIEVGDTVQLTASLLLKFQEHQPDLYAALVEAGISYGEIVAVNGNDISIELKPEKSGYNPIKITISATQPHLVLQVVRKADGSPANGVMTLSPATQAAAQVAEPAPGTQMAQWVFTQFLQFKQFGIIQDLQRRSDVGAPGPGNYDPSDQWKNNPTNLRAVRVSLTDEEEQLYVSAMERMRREINDDIIPQVPAKIEGPDNP